MKLPSNPAARALLRIPATIYEAAVRARNRFYDRPSSTHRAGIPVVCVGNLTIGGTGKTPLVAWLARHMISAGRRPAVVSRGYGGTAGRGPLVVSEGRGALHDARVCGDEPYLLAETLAGVAVVVGSDRCAGAAAAVGLGADTVILDDGFQHRRLDRDLDIVLLDAGDPFGNHRLVPAGPLREPISSLRRAGIVLLTRSHPDQELERLERTVRRHNTIAPILRAGHRCLGFFDVRGKPVEPPGRAVAFCGIGNPGLFRTDLENRGIEISGFRAYRDHHPYSAEEVAELIALAASHQAALVTTHKDLVRLPAGLPDPTDGPPLVAMHVESVVYQEQTFLAALHRALGRSGV